MENLLTTIPKQTTEKTLNSSHNYMFKHLILLAHFAGQYLQSGGHFNKSWSCWGTFNGQ